MNALNPFPGKGLQLYERPWDCLADVLRVFVEQKDEDGGDVLYLEADTYNHVGVRHEEDPRVVPSPLRVLRVVNYATARDQFNLDLVCEEYIDVRHREFKGMLRPMRRYRTFSIVHHGELNVRELRASLTEASYDLLKVAGVVAPDTGYNPPCVYRIHLPGVRELPLVSRYWADPLVMNLVKLLRTEQELMAEQRLLNKRLRELNQQAGTEVYGEQGSGRPLYRGSSKQVMGKVELYHVPCVSIRLKNRKADPPGHAAALSREEVSARQMSVRAALRMVRYRLCMINLAMQLYPLPTITWGLPEQKINRAWKSSRTYRSTVLEGEELVKVEWSEPLERSVL